MLLFHVCVMALLSFPGWIRRSKSCRASLITRSNEYAIRKCYNLVNVNMVPSRRYLGNAYNKAPETLPSATVSTGLRKVSAGNLQKPSSAIIPTLSRMSFHLLPWHGQKYQKAIRKHWLESDKPKVWEESRW